MIYVGEINYSVILKQKIMGGQVCGEQKTQIEDPLSWKLDKDPREKGIQHSGQIICGNKQVQKNLDVFAQTLRSEKTLYKDSSMPSDPILLRSKTTQIKCTYERPYKFLDNCARDSIYKLIDYHDASPDTIEVKDQVMQYLGVFLCFLSDKANLIKKIILTDQNSYGMHAIEAYRNGHIVHLLIDDYILCKDMKPIFTQPCKMMYMWPCLIEKAWLKIRGNLAKRVEQTSPEELFQTFLPLPIEKFYFDEGVNTASKATLTKIFEKCDYKNKGYILTSKKNPEHQIGLSGRRHFYLMSTFMFEGRRFFYIRNPCVDMSFRGTYSQIPDQIIRLIEQNFLKIAPGNFVLDEQEFLEQIGEVMVVHYLQGNKISTLGFTTGNAEQFFIGFNLKYKGQLNLKITQTPAYHEKNQDFYPLMYHVLRLSDQKIIGGMQNREGCFGSKHTHLLDNFCEEALPGKYLIRIKKKQIEKTLPKMVTFLTSYFIDKVDFDIITTEEMSSTWQNFLQSQAKRRLDANPSKLKKLGSDISHVICWFGDLVVIYVQKIGIKKQQVSIQVNFPQLMNLECISHPEIRRSNDWKTYTFTDNIMFIFQKIDLTAQTHIRQYHLESF